jgi:hypothetical protein
MKTVRKIGEFLTRHPKSTLFGALFLAVAVFLGIVLSKIGVWSVWFDESFSAFMIKQSFADIWNYTALDVNAPLYYYLLKIWSLVVGHSDVALRLLSVIFGVGALIGGFFLSRRLFGQRVGYFTLPFLALSPMLLRYATEMRCYTLLIFLLIMATYVFVVASQKEERKWWLLYGFLIAAAMWTHYYAALPILAHFLWRAVTLRKKFFSRNFVLGLVLAAMLFLPWLPTMIHQLTVVQNNGFWIAPFGLDTAGNFLSEMMVYSTHDRVTNFAALGLILAIVLVTFLLVKGWRTLAKKARLNLYLLLLLIFLPPLILVVLSMPPLRPMFINRYVIFSMAIFSLLIALAVGVKFKSRLLRATQIACLILMLVLSGWGIRNILHFGNYNFDTNSVSMVKNLMTQVVAGSSEKTIVIADNPWIFYDANVYATEKTPVFFLDSSTKYEYGSLAMLRDDKTHKIVDLMNFVEKGQKVWYISSTKNAVPTSTGGGESTVKNWQKLRELSAKNSFSDDTSFAVEYLVE